MVGEEVLPFFLCEVLAAYGTAAVLQDDTVCVGDEHGVVAEGRVFLRGGGAVEEDVRVHAHEVASPVDYGGGVVVAVGGEGDADAASLPQQSVNLFVLGGGEAYDGHDGVFVALGVVPVLRDERVAWGLNMEDGGFAVFEFEMYVGTRVDGLASVLNQTGEVVAMAVVVFGQALGVWVVETEPHIGTHEEQKVEDAPGYGDFLVGVAAAAGFDQEVDGGNGNGDEEPEEEDQEEQDDEVVVPKCDNGGGDKQSGDEFEIFHGLSGQGVADVGCE